MVKTLTVIFIVWATTALAMFGKLDSAVSAIFSGIAGYVLGKDFKNNTPLEDDNGKSE